MGTNYYLQQRKDYCSHCQRWDMLDKLHIGKSSGGWNFLLRVYTIHGDRQPEDGETCIPDLDAWMPLLTNEENLITNEYGNTIGNQEMIDIITKKSWCQPGETPEEVWKNRDWDRIRFVGDPVRPRRTEQDFHAQNNSERGENGLLRHRHRGDARNHNRTWPGPPGSTYDLCENEFS